MKRKLFGFHCDVKLQKERKMKLKRKTGMLELSCHVVARIKLIKRKQSKLEIVARGTK